MKLSKIALIAALGIGCVYGCKKAENTTSAAIVSPTPTKIELSEIDTGTTLNVANGGTVIVTLVEDTTKNLKWVVSTSGSLKLTDESKKTPEPNAEKRIFTFKAVQPGKTVITFAYGSYTHEWDSALKSVSFTIIVQ
jgi:predicted secreted protein